MVRIYGWRQLSRLRFPAQYPAPDRSTSYTSFNCLRHITFTNRSTSYTSSEFPRSITCPPSFNQSHLISGPPLDHLYPNAPSVTPPLVTPWPAVVRALFAPYLRFIDILYVALLVRSPGARRQPLPSASGPSEGDTRDIGYNFARFVLLT